MSDAKAMVASGYDQIAETYLCWTSSSSVRTYWLDAFIPTLPVGARVLDLGCGAGVPAARRLTEHGCAVLGVDGSQRHVSLARINVP